MPTSPNILFIMTDQHRGDSIGADPQCPSNTNGGSLVQTPNIDNLIENGSLFTNAYSPAPTCGPARRCLWTGQNPSTNGCVKGGNISEEWDFLHSIPQNLRDAGYQTWLVGKTHSEPPGNHFGFEGIDLHSGLFPVEQEGVDDYANWIAHQENNEYHEESHGLGRNGWYSRPWHLSEHKHPTHWTASRAIEFLETRRDPTRPFFLTVSFVRPHQPYDPPEAYWDLYDDLNLPDPPVGEWVTDRYEDHMTEFPATNSWYAELSKERIQRARTGYYGSITHIDNQIFQILRWVKKLEDWDNTLVIFTSDHGDMLGDHNLWRKSVPFEGSARIPLIVNLPDHTGMETNQYIDQPVGLEDIMPTILDVANVDVPESVDGKSLLELLENPKTEDWRSYYHGESGPNRTPDSAMQYIVNKNTKYIWDPITGNELLFDLQSDPNEVQDLSDSAEHTDQLNNWRRRLANQLEGRSEGFSDGEHLQTITPDDWE